MSEPSPPVQVATRREPLRALGHAEPTDPAAPRGLRLEGQVVDGAEDPIADAVIVLGPEKRIVHAQADGSFAFEDLEPGDYTLTARAGERVGFQAVRLAGAIEPVVVIIAGGAKLEVAVRARGGAPIAGAELYLAPLGLTTATDESGAATIPGIPSGRHALQVRKAGFANVQRVLRLGAAGEATRVAIELAPGGAVAGVVETPDGRPASRATVSLTPSGGALAGVVGELVAETDAAGRFRVAGAGAGTATVIARHPDHAPSEVVALQVVAGGEVDEVRLQLRAGRRVTGRVVDDAGAVEGAVVAVSGERLQHTRSGPDGAFALGGLPAGPLSLVATRGGRSSGPTSVDGDRIELRLPAAAALAGVVADRGGRNVARARVIAVGRGVRRLEIADEGGRFELRDLVAGEYRLHADWPDARNGDRALLTAGTLARTGQDDVRLLLSGRATVRGRLERGDGGEVGPFTVRVGRGAAAAFAGARSEFALDDVPAGRQWIAITGRAFAEVALGEVPVPESGVLDLGVIPVTAGRRLRGRVVDEQGRPVAGARVQTGRGLVGTGSQLLGDGEQAEAAQVRSSETGPDGSFEIPGLSPNGGVAAAEHVELGRSAGVVVPPGDSDVVLELTVRPDAALAGELIGPGGPIAEREVVASPVGAGNVRFLARTDGRGAFRFDRLARGSYILAGHSATAGRLACAVHTVVEVAGAHTTATLSLPALDRELDLALGDTGRPALVYVVPGDAAPATVGDAEAAAQAAPSGVVCAGLVRADGGARMRYPRADAATLCVSVLPIDPDDPNAGMRLLPELARLPVTCGRVAPGQDRFALAPR